MVGLTAVVTPELDIRVDERTASRPERFALEE
jgi:hypothetical protein